MPYTPEFPDEIRRRMLTRLVSTSRLVDLSEGSEFGALLGVVADEMSSFQQKLGEFHDAHFFRANGQLLDDRVAQLPVGFPRRRDARPASGGSCTITRSLAASAATYYPGQLVFGRDDLPNLKYTNTDSVTFGIGVFTATGVNLVCQTPGFFTNAPPGAINTLIAAPGTIYSVTNTLPLSGGAAREEDFELSARAELWVSALTRTTSSSIEALVLNFQGSNGTSVRTCRVWESPDTPGYCEVLIDDGFGFSGSTRDAVAHTGVVPSIDEYTTRYQFTFDAPANTAPILTIDGVDYPSPNADYLTVEERGSMLMRSSPTSIPVSAGSSWSTGGHKVLTGLPAEIQSYVEANCRAAGSRVRVRLPEVTELRLSANVTVFPGYNPTAVFNAIKLSIVDYVSRIPPGQPILIFRLAADLIVVPGVRNIIFDQTDRYPGTPSTKFVCYYNSISLR